MLPEVWPSSSSEYHCWPFVTVSTSCLTENLRWIFGDVPHIFEDEPHYWEFGDVHYSRMFDDELHCWAFGGVSHCGTFDIAWCFEYFLMDINVWDIWKYEF